LDDEIPDYVEIPEKYIDPLMYTLMTNPVMLPSSKNIMDYSNAQMLLL